VSLALWVGDYAFEVGSADFLQSFFSTVAVRAEQGHWGSKFPVLMEALYSGLLRAEAILQARIELEGVRRALSAFKPSEVVWDAADPSALPPWGDLISPTITSLADYFVTSDGKPLIEVFDHALVQANARGVDVRIS